jgi:hypothetical protein
VRDDGDRAGVTEVALGSVDAVLHQRLDVAHVVLVDDLLAERVDDDDHDLRRPVDRLRTVPAPVAGLGTGLGPGDRERDRGCGDEGEQVDAVLSHDDSLPARRRCRGP